MKVRHLLVSFFVFIISFFSQNLIAQPVDIDYHVGCRHAKHQVKLKPLTPEEKNLLNTSNGRSDTIDILNYNITIDVTNFSQEKIIGACEILFTPKIDSVFEMTLDLLDFEIDSITGPDGNMLEYDYNGFLVDVLFSDTLITEDTTSIFVYYNGHPTVDPTGFGGFDFRDNIAYNLGIGLGSNPYNYGRGWFPCFDNFVERATYDLNIITEGERKGYGIGTFLGEEDLSEDQVMRSYRMAQQLPTYLVGVAVGNYATHHSTHEGVYGAIPVELIGHAGDTTSIKNSFAELGNAIDALEYWFGPYQWERVGYVMTSVGAMEHSTSIAYPRSVALSGANPSQNRLMAHELAHHWWGNITTLSTPSDMWIKEGNAEYGAHLFTEYAFGTEYFKEVVKDNHKTVLEDAHIDDDGYQPLSGIPYEQTYGTHSYQKGASMMHNLRGYLGDSLFKSGMTSLLNAFPYDAIDAATFRDHLTDATGIEMTSFFDDWIYAPGYADYEINSVDVTQNDDQYNVEVEIQQKLLAAPHFHTNAPMEITFFDEELNTHTEKFMVSGEYSTAEFSIPFAPIMQILNDNNLLNLGRTQKRFIIETTGFADVDYTGFFQFQVNELESPVMVNVVHHLTAADSSESPFIDQIASKHYWTVSGNVEGTLGAKITIQYQGQNENRLDYDLLEETEEDLLLLWRSNPQEEWQEYPYYDKVMLGSTTDGNGFIRMEPFMMGEYALANGEFPVNTNDIETVNQLSVFPNPANASFFVEGKLANDQEGLMQIFSLDGKLLHSRTVSGVERIAEQFEVNDMAEGTYLIKLMTKEGIELATEQVVIIK